VLVAGKEGSKTPIRRQSTSAKSTKFFPFDEVGINADQNAQAERRFLSLLSIATGLM